MIHALMAALSLQNLLLAFVGVVAGTAVGALPGLTATMAVAVLVPFTFTMDSAPALVMLGAIYTGAIYGGAYSAILLNTPGTPSAVATTFDGYPMAKRGDGDLAITLSCIASVVRRPGRRAGAVAAGAAAGASRAGVRSHRVFLAGRPGPDAGGGAVHRRLAQRRGRRLHRPDDVDDRFGRHRRRHPLHDGHGNSSIGDQRHPGLDRPVLHPRVDRSCCLGRGAPQDHRQGVRLPLA